MPAIVTDDGVTLHAEEAGRGEPLGQVPLAKLLPGGELAGDDQLTDEGGVNAVGAVANAVRDALGLVGGIGQLPLTPARVWALAHPAGGPL